MTVAPESSIYTDSGYTACRLEDDVKDAESLKLMIQRKSNSKRKAEPWGRVSIYVSFLKSKKNYMSQPTP